MYFPFTKNKGGTNSIFAAIELFLCYYLRQMPGIKMGGGTRMQAKTVEEKLDYGGATDRFKSYCRGYDESRMWLMCGCDRRCHVTSCACVMKFAKSGDVKHASSMDVALGSKTRKRERKKRIKRISQRGINVGQDTSEASLSSTPARHREPMTR